MAMSASTGPRTFPAEWLPRPEDEYVHQPRGDESYPWKDTFFVVAHDPQTNACVNMHLTVSANRRPDTRCAVGVSQGNRSVSQVCREDGDNSTKSVGNSQARLEFINPTWGPDHEIRWVADLDEVELDLTIRGKHWATLWDTMFKGYYSGGEVDGQFYSHLEQIITLEGTLRWKDGEPQPFSGFGWRDRGWGRRKTQLMWNTGWDLMSAILPDDSAFSVIGLRQHELPEPAPMPIGGWWTDGTDLSPLVGGYFHKDATSHPLRYDLEFANGHRVAAEYVHFNGRVQVAMQESETGPEAPNLAVAMIDMFSTFRDGDGNAFPVFSEQGFIHKVDVFRDAQFIHAGNAPVGRAPGRA